MAGGRWLEASGWRRVAGSGWLWRAGGCAGLVGEAATSRLWLQQMVAEGRWLEAVDRLEEGEFQPPSSREAGGRWVAGGWRQVAGGGWRGCGSGCGIAHWQYIYR